MNGSFLKYSYVFNVPLNFNLGYEHLSVLAFGEWDGKNKRGVSLDNEDEHLIRNSINGDQSVESLKKNLPLHQQQGNSIVQGRKTLDISNIVDV
ncbi:hypothetical protein IEQ34_021353 [Dendrobium chrysotoxum]|uniref:Uncharacterized protein n=1 Tax=Dendrobium chrysotoxum TaxID=161865 RepID=A0AAV7G2Q5_DENCH|nr:hypothetical protein IEQ34_021353 [Dendrobium chrysotoxum]